MIHIDLTRGIVADLRLIGVPAGINKYGFTECPLCGNGPSKDVSTEGNFMFRDGQSAVEYQISALCQDCQDKTFTEGV